MLVSSIAPPEVTSAEALHGNLGTLRPIRPLITTSNLPRFNSSARVTGQVARECFHCRFEAMSGHLPYVGNGLTGSLQLLAYGLTPEATASGSFSSSEKNPVSRFFKVGHHFGEGQGAAVDLSDGCREHNLGSTSHPWGTAHARLRHLGADDLPLDETSAEGLRAS